ncbi:MAG: RNA polymerase sigma factor [Parvibaculaceae bacterium]|nr:RNA polymerase sigma factor [Parvibaculaceae bacterium]
MTEENWLETQFSDIRPRAIAALSRHFRDVEIAEEAFAVAYERALKKWPESGEPNKPFAWLLVVGRNAGRDILRKRSVHIKHMADIQEPAQDDIEEILANTDGLRDDVLRLLFICCHPSLAPQDQAALALRIVSGLSVGEIAKAFLVKPRTMEQRITRAKKMIADTQTPFEVPSLTERLRRLNAVMLMIYLLFNEGWSAHAGDVHIKAALCEEAIRLARLLLGLFPNTPETMGLLALLLVQHSRLAARINNLGELVVLDKQDRTLWDRSLINEGLALLEKALLQGSPGSYQIQAAIAAVHSDATLPSETDWHEIERLYKALSHIDPSPVIKLNHASVLAQIEGPQTALDLLDHLSTDLKAYRWFHAARGAFLFDLQRYPEAKQAYQAALALDVTAQEALFLCQKILNCEKNIKRLSE